VSVVSSRWALLIRQLVTMNRRGYKTLRLTTCRTLARPLGLRETTGSRRVIGHAKEVGDYEDCELITCGGFLTQGTVILLVLGTRA
jgi:hypothetical protein